MKKGVFTVAFLLILGFASLSPAQTTVTLTSDPVLDGFVLDTGSVLNAIAAIQVGDNAGNYYARGFVSFDPSGCDHRFRHIAGQSVRR